MGTKKQALFAHDGNYGAGRRGIATMVSMARKRNSKKQRKQASRGRGRSRRGRVRDIAAERSSERPRVQFRWWSDSDAFLASTTGLILGDGTAYFWPTKSNGMDSGSPK